MHYIASCHYQVCDAFDFMRSLRGSEGEVRQAQREQLAQQAVTSLSAGIAAEALALERSLYAHTNSTCCTLHTAQCTLHCTPTPRMPSLVCRTGAMKASLLERFTAGATFTVKLMEGPVFGAPMPSDVRSKLLAELFKLEPK